MRRPFRQYCFRLAEKLGKSLDEVMEMGCPEIAEWMAYDLTKTEAWQKKWEEIKSREMSAQEKADMMKKLIGG